VPDQFISLRCSGCGAKLDVYDDMDRFTCRYCQTEMVVQRRGGTVALKAITDAIHEVRIGTDKTAAELAIARYEKELGELYSQAEVLDGRKTTAIGTLFGIGALIGLAGLSVVAFTQAFVPGGISAGVGIVCVVIAYLRADPSPELVEIRRKISDLEKRVAAKKRIADS
jgi:ribosomal protein S27E